MYKVYLKIYNHLGKSEVLTDTRTTTPSPAAAEAAFRELINRADLIGSQTHAVLSLNNRHLMYHRFDRQPGETDYVAPDAKINLFHTVNGN
jgi:hypothetical protein